VAQPLIFVGVFADFGVWDRSIRKDIDSKVKVQRVEKRNENICWRMRSLTKSHTKGAPSESIGKTTSPSTKQIEQQLLKNHRRLAGLRV
jgi:hypothetical protein